jgi:hypothetical protein
VKIENRRTKIAIKKEKKTTAAVTRKCRRKIKGTIVK